MEALDQRKYDAIQLTFKQVIFWGDFHKKNINLLLDIFLMQNIPNIDFSVIFPSQVSKYFEDVFAKLVAGGRAQLDMRIDDSDPNLPRVEQFTGVRIRVHMNKINLSIFSMGTSFY